MSGVNCVHTDERRFSLPALLVAAGAESISELARQCSVHVRQMQRYRADGIPECVADRMAVRAGLHPGEVWPEWFASPVKAAS